jgi:hypothetical protein
VQEEAVEVLVAAEEEAQEDLVVSVAEVSVAVDQVVVGKIKLFYNKNPGNELPGFFML